MYFMFILGTIHKMSYVDEIVKNQYSVTFLIPSILEKTYSTRDKCDDCHFNHSIWMVEARGL